MGKLFLIASVLSFDTSWRSSRLFLVSTKSKQDHEIASCIGLTSVCLREN